MLAARLHVPGEPLVLEEVPLPEPSGTAVRVRVAGCGVCGTDLQLADGGQPRVTLPRTLGHEIAGWVDAAGPDAGPDLRASGLRDGDAVLVYGGWGCGSCRECRSGAAQRCPDSVAPGFQADGGYAEAMLVPAASHLEPVGGLDPVHAAPLADAGATAHRAVSRAQAWLSVGARVAVIGAGGVGQLLLQLLRHHAGGRELAIVVAEPDARRRARAQTIGADATVPDATGLRDTLGGPADLVVDVVGNDETLAAAAQLVAPGGAVILVGERGGVLPFGFERTPLEAWLTTVSWASRDDLGAVVRLAQAGELSWTTERLPLADANAAHARVRSRDIEGRIVLVPPGDGRRG